MTRCLFSLVLLFFASTAFAAEFEAITRQVVKPLLIRNDHNSLLNIVIRAPKPFIHLRSITVDLEGSDNIESMQFYYTANNGGYSTQMPFGDRVRAKSKTTFRGHIRLGGGENHLWLSCRMKTTAKLTAKVDGRVVSIETSAGTIQPKDTTNGIKKRIGIALRRHWDDGVHTYRIPALGTSTAGTLLSVYDIRRRAGRDLQEDIDIGLLRSTDGGQTWGAQQVIMDMHTFGDKGQELNGCSDPGIIIDPTTGEIFVFAVWMHLKPGKHQWNPDGSERGHEIGKSAQFLMVTSKDDGKTWSKPVNLTKQLKDPKWILYAPSPQQGIVLRDGTLVMPTQGRDAKDKHFSNLLISHDHGKTWKVSNPASLGNTECQAVELSDGSIMLNCRTEHPTKYRTVAVTRDLGKTWSVHPTSRKTLIEPSCNGSTYRFDYTKEGQKKSVLLFANPYSQKSRTHHSIRVSFDDGMTWPENKRLLLDEGGGAGYPSLSRVDNKHVGIVYEGSGSHIVFEKIAIEELVDR